WESSSNSGNQSLASCPFLKHTCGISLPPGAPEHAGLVRPDRRGAGVAPPVLGAGPGGDARPPPARERRRAPRGRVAPVQIVHGNPHAHRVRGVERAAAGDAGAGLCGAGAAGAVAQRGDRMSDLGASLLTVVLSGAKDRPKHASEARCPLLPPTRSFAPLRMTHRAHLNGAPSPPPAR